MKYYLAIKIHKGLIHTETWVTLGNIMLSEEINHKRPHIVWFDLHEVPRTGKSRETEGRLWLLMVSGGGTVGGK